LDSEKHLRLTGGLIMNLQAVETVLRYFLVLQKGETHEFPKIGDTCVQETFATNYMSLGFIIDVYNNGLDKVEAPLYTVDRGIVQIRDAFAHGRLVTRNNFPATLWKFGRAKSGNVPIEFSVVLTEEWLVKTNNSIVREKDRVIGCSKARGYVGLS
jgi:hypothetical protein